MNAGRNGPFKRAPPGIQFARMLLPSGRLRASREGRICNGPQAGKKPRHIVRRLRDCRRGKQTNEQQERRTIREIKDSQDATFLQLYAGETINAF